MSAIDTSVFARRGSRLADEGASLWRTVAESVSDLANPLGGIVDTPRWYEGFRRDRDAIRRDFWNAITTYTRSADVIPGQEQLFDPERVGA